MTQAPPAPVAIDDGAAAELRTRMRGEVIRPDDPAYAGALRIWNGMIERRPAIIARCRGAADVRAAVDFARGRGLAPSIRGGGHNVGGNALSDGGLTIDLSAMKGIRVDPGTARVRLEPGLTLGELDHETQAFGLAVPAGIVPTTGVAGLTLGGGIGWLMRRHGLTCDRLRSADVVTADGRLVHASEDENPDLLWGLRGGGGNFGVVTSFEFEAARVGPEVLAGFVLFPLEDGEEVLRRYRDWATDAPDEATTVLSLRTVLPMAPFPPELHGRRVVSVGVVWAGDPAAGELAVAPLRSLGRPLFDVIGRKPFVAHQRSLEASAPWGMRYYFKSEFLADLSDEAIRVLVEHNLRAPQPWSHTIVFHLGGAISRVDSDAAAFEDRRAQFAINATGVVETAAEDAAMIAWARDEWTALRTFSMGGAYVNFLMDEGDERIRATYGEAKYERLAALKARWDPDNVFRLNQNVRPAAG